jgi:hypothetical protein
MTSPPDWLPNIVSVSGRWGQVVARLYRIFDHDFRQTGCAFETRPVWWDQTIREGPYEEGFWHLITKFDPQQNERLLDPRRAERLPWCKPTIVNSDEPTIKVWRYQEGGKRNRTYLWLEGWDYVVVLEERTLKGGKEIAFLITAFHVEGESTRRRLRKKYENRVDRPQNAITAP